MRGLGIHIGAPFDRSTVFLLCYVDTLSMASVDGSTFAIAAELAIAFDGHGIINSEQPHLETSRFEMKWVDYILQAKPVVSLKHAWNYLLRLYPGLQSPKK
jgi:hypothetical protein